MSSTCLTRKLFFSSPLAGMRMIGVIEGRDRSGVRDLGPVQQVLQAVAKRVDVVGVVLGLEDDAVVLRRADADRRFDVGIHEGSEARRTGLEIADNAVQTGQLAHSSSFGPKTQTKRAGGNHRRSSCSGTFAR
jgi:hypothetical protein